MTLLVFCELCLNHVAILMENESLQPDMSKKKYLNTAIATISVMTFAEFHSEVGKIQYVLHPNEHPQRNFSNLVRQLDADLSKI